MGIAAQQDSRVMPLYRNPTKATERRNSPEAGVLHQTLLITSNFILALVENTSRNELPFYSMNNTILQFKMSVYMSLKKQRWLFAQKCQFSF